MRFKKVFIENVRVRGMLERAKEIGLDGRDILERISKFENVEKYQHFKNIHTAKKTRLAYCIERIGGNGYRLIRNNK